MSLMFQYGAPYFIASPPFKKVTYSLTTGAIPNGNAGGFHPVASNIPSQLNYVTFMFMLPYFIMFVNSFLPKYKPKEY